MIFPEERYELVEHLVLEYQNGNREYAGEKLVNLFEPLFSKYIKIVKHGIFDFNDYDSRHFLSLFISDVETRNNLIRRFQSKKTREIAYRTLYYINLTCLQTFEEDLYQELITIFLKFVTSYKPDFKPKTHFCSYLNSSFGFAVANSIKKIISNPLNTSILTDFDEDFIESYSTAIVDDTYSDDLIPSNELDELGNSWTYGQTCSKVFSDLTPFERLILKMSYIDNISDGDIGKKSGFHRNSILLKRHNAIKKIRARMASDTDGKS